MKERSSRKQYLDQCLFSLNKVLSATGKKSIEKVMLEM